MADRVASFIPECLGFHHRTWDWELYHAELLRRSEALPPLMRSLQNERRNYVDWLAPERFPLPAFLFENVDDQTVRKRSLAEAPATFDSEHQAVTIETRCGTVAHILRASLITALVKAPPEKRRKFFGCSFDEAMAPRVAYVSWRALMGSLHDPATPPKQNDSEVRSEAASQRGRIIHTPSLWDLMIRSLPFASSNANGTSVQRGSAPQNTTPHAHECFGQEPAKETSPQTIPPPTILIIDAIGAPADYGLAIVAISSELAALAWPFDSTNAQQVASADGDGTVAIVLSTSLHGSHESFLHAFNQGLCEGVVFVDAPTTQMEHRFFMECWERWRAPQARQRVIAQGTDSHLEQLERSLSQLGMITPEAPTGDSTFAYEGETNIAIFDIECAISAILRDKMPCSTPSQLWRGISERLHPQEIQSARRVLSAFLQGRALLTDVPSLEAETFVEAYYLLPDAPIMQLIPLSGTALDSQLTTLAYQISNDSLGLAHRIEVDLNNNPLLTALLLPLFDEDRHLTTYQLINEPLAVAIFAQYAIASLEQTSDLLEMSGVLYVVFLMSASIWTHFIEGVFELLDESTLPGLAADVLSNFAGMLNDWTGSEPDDCIDQISGQSSDNFADEFILKTARLLLSRPAKHRLSEYVDALTRVSIQHVIYTDSTLPWAWASWIGLLPSEEEIPDASTLLERIEWLTHLLDGPIPTCDNVLKLLRLFYDIIVENIDEVEPDCPCYVHKDVLRRHLLQRFPQRP